MFGLECVCVCVCVCVCMRVYACVEAYGEAVCCCARALCAYALLV